MHDVVPGVYDIYPFARFTQSTRSVYYIGSATIEVTNRDTIAGPISIRPGVEMRGRVTVNGIPPKGRVGNALVGRTSLDSLPSSVLSFGDSPTSLALVDRESGEFMLADVPPGVYRANKGTNLPLNSYIASALVDGKDVLGDEITIGNEAPDTLEVEVATPGAIVQGAVFGAQN